MITGLAILALGFAGGLFLALFYQGQAVILAGAAIVLAFLTWLGSGADLMGLLREIYKEGKDEEKRTKRAVYESVEPQLSKLRRELVFAQQAHTDNDIPKNETHLLAFHHLLQDSSASGNLRYISKNAPSAIAILLRVNDRVTQPYIAGMTAEIMFHDDTLQRTISLAISQIDAWLNAWDKWRS